MREWGLLGGTFDPIHFGHINLGLELLEKHRLEKVLLCPAHHSPFKGAHPPLASPEDRLAMAHLALQGLPHFELSPLEIERGKREGGPSYTIDTVRALQHPGIRLRLLLSEESAAHLESWKEASELVRLAPPLIGTRNPQEPTETRTRILEISSTEIRSRLRQKLYCGHLVPAPVLSYIQQQGLYH